MWDKVKEFLSAWSFPAILESVRELDWGLVLRNPLVWIVTIPILVFLIWRKQIRIMVLMASFVCLLFLIQATFVPAGESMPLQELLKFVGGTLGLAVVNLYFFFMRD